MHMLKRMTARTPTIATTIFIVVAIPPVRPRAVDITPKNESNNQTSPVNTPRKISNTLQLE